MHPPPFSSSSSSHVVIHHPDPNWLSFSLSNNNHINNAAPTPVSLFHPHTEEEPQPPHPSSPHLSRSVPDLSVSDFLSIPPPPHTNADIYDATDLKTITASFLCGFYGDISRDNEYQMQPQRQQELQLPTSEGRHHHQQQQAGKRDVDTFRQRTSIYRGVTR